MSNPLGGTPSEPSSFSSPVMSAAHPNHQGGESTQPDHSQQISEIDLPDTDRTTGSTTAGYASGTASPSGRSAVAQGAPSAGDEAARAAAADEAAQEGPVIGPGMGDDGRPKIIHADWDEFREMIERRDRTILERVFGGVSGITTTFLSNATTGVESDTVQARMDQFGENVLSKKDPVTFLEFLIEAFQDQIVIILCIAAVISIVFGTTLPNPHSGEREPDKGWIEGFAIILSVALVTLTGSINNYRKAKKFEEMERIQAIRELTVTRGGTRRTIPSNELVVGDVLAVKAGMEVPCDALYLRGNGIKVSEAALTGEPDLMEKSSDQPFFISGTVIELGDGEALVVAVGMGSFQGSLKAQLDGDSGQTPLQEHLEELAELIGKFGLAGAVVLLVALSIKEGILISQDKRDASPATFLSFFLIAVTLIAVAIPEGLPLAVTISLAYSMSAMMKDNCLVRVLASCETMGAATAICSDKTGTLTTNQMTVVQGLVADEEFMIDGYALDERGPAKRNRRVARCEKSGDGLHARVGTPETVRTDLLEDFCYAVAVNCTAGEAEEKGELVWVGNHTECGMLKWMKSMGMDYTAFRARVPRDDTFAYPFSSETKRMTTLVRDRSGVVTAYVKGASEAILEHAQLYRSNDGSIQELTEEKRAEFMLSVQDMAMQGNRTIGVSMADMPPSMLPNETGFPKEEPKVATVFLGVLGIQDPVRSNVPQAVLDAASAGVTTRMVTGDNIDTAIAIAKKCNIYRDDGFDLALTGPEFRQMERTNQAALLELLPRVKVLARSSPQDKHVLVGMLKEELGEVVGVTGDGTNDAPALKLADVGFAMKTGTDIAHSASDMVLLDDNFATVVTAIKWGRAVNDNVKKFLQFQLAINCSGVALTLVGSLASETSKEPFTPVQLLWLNLIMDTLAAIALSTELPENACLQRPPVFKQAPLITNRMRCFIAVHGGVQFTVILLFLFLGHAWFNTVEDPDVCDQDYPPVLGNVTETNSDNIEITVLRNVTNPITTACVKLCEDEGGVYHSEDHTCQQGYIHSTIIFNTYIWFQIFNVVNARKIYGEMNPFEGVWTRSKNLLAVFGFILALQIVAVEFFRDFMSTRPLTWQHWLICVGVGASELIVGALQRLIPITDHVPDFVERKEARLKELREEHTSAHTHGLIRRDSAILRSGMPANKTSAHSSRRASLT